MKHWVFDLDGTLVDSLGYYDLKLAKIFAHYETEFTPEAQKLSHNYFDAREFFKLYLPEHCIGPACDQLETLSIEMAPRAKPFDGIFDVLNFLEQRSVELSVWTGRDFKSGRKILEHSGLQRYFKNFVSGSCVSKVKPDPEGLLKLMDSSEFKSHETVMIGDHAHDMKGALSAGAKAVSVSWDFHGEHALQSLSEQHFSRVSDLYDWVKKHF